MEPERSGSLAAGQLAALQRGRVSTGTRMAAGGNGTSLWLLAGATGATLRPQRELGLTAAGAGRAASGKHSAAGARRRHCRPSRDEVSGAGCACQPRRVRAAGCRFRPPALRHTASGADLHGLAQRLAHHTPADPGGPGAVAQDAANTRRHSRPWQTRTRSRCRLCRTESNQPRAE